MIAVDRQRARGAGALRSVLLQQRIDSCEVLLFDFGRDRFPPLPGSDHPSVRTIPLRRGWTYGMFRAYAATIARAPIVAFLEEHARAESGWLESMLAAFAAGATGVGGVPGNANPQMAISRLLFLSNYWRHLSITRPVETSLLPGQNSAYLRSALLELSSVVLETEPALDAAIIRAGGRLILDPSVRWLHMNEPSVRSMMRGFFFWGRTTGWAFSTVFGWSAVRRGIRVVRLPLTPFVRVGKLLGAVRHSPDQRTLVLRNIRSILLTEYAQAAGIVVGLVFGPGDAPKRFFDFDLNAPRAA